MNKSLIRFVSTFSIVVAFGAQSQAALTVTNLISAPSRIGAMVSGQVTATNGYNNCVFATVYYGKTDGTNVAASWANSVAADQTCVTNGAALTGRLMSLSEGTTYFWRLKVTEANESNSATAWASSSATFTTATTARGAAGFLILPGTTNSIAVVITNLSVVTGVNTTNTFKFLTTP